MSELFYFAAGIALMIALMLLYRRYASFLAQSAADYVEDIPNFDLRQHLNGPIQCEGVIYGPLGRVTSRFSGDFEAEWDGNRGIMKEHFRYHSGNTQDREWRLELGNDGAIKADADDLVGQGQGQQSGATVQLRYKIRLPEDAGGHVLSVSDWMYLTPGGTIVNRSQFRKWGIKVAELVATMQKKENA
ncbi:DUF3833 family protein [Roseovarius aestuariivivens]|uniref:DUF3833 family protein n=1 Tax=Roseovarius aestuariivivens TaxID=1888910 RepID=UPI001081D391|nr:DUF3833 family protein [Roseovarius aestuariivivens]